VTNALTSRWVASKAGVLITAVAGSGISGRVGASDAGSEGGDDARASPRCGTQSGRPENRISLRICSSWEVSSIILRPPRLAASSALLAAARLEAVCTTPPGFPRRSPYRAGGADGAPGVPSPAAGSTRCPGGADPTSGRVAASWHEPEEPAGRDSPRPPQHPDQRPPAGNRSPDTESRSGSREGGRRAARVALAATASLCAS
jgi:hypothetical protein